MKQLSTRLFGMILLIALLGCNLINPKEEIPAYIRIDTVQVVVHDIDKGSNSHNMNNIWISVGGENLGVFELPVLLPTYDTGMQTLTIRPGIKLNGIGASRIAYPFFKPYVIDLELYAGKIQTVTPVTTYKSECDFRWMEDFEDPGVSFNYPDYTDTVFQNQNLVVKGGNYSGAIFLNKKSRFFEATSRYDFDLPRHAVPIILEFDYLCTNSLEVGMYIIQDGAAVWNPLVKIKPMDHWNRYYVDINTTVNSEPNADLFRMGLRAEWDQPDSLPSVIYLDNLKLITF